MVEGTGTGNLQRLEDYVALASEGKRVSGTVELRKQPIKQKVHPEDTTNLSDEIDMYLLLADFDMTADGHTQKISKVYALGSSEESIDSSRVNRSVATERLKMDYARLKKAGIKLQEKYF
jgi:hypothetical protein